MLSATKTPKELEIAATQRGNSVQELPVPAQEVSVSEQNPVHTVPSFTDCEWSQFMPVTKNRRSVGKSALIRQWKIERLDAQCAFFILASYKASNKKRNHNNNPLPFIFTLPLEILKNIIIILLTRSFTVSQVRATLTIEGQIQKIDKHLNQAEKNKHVFELFRSHLLMVVNTFPIQEMNSPFFKDLPTVLFARKLHHFINQFPSLTAATCWNDELHTQMTLYVTALLTFFENNNDNTDLKTKTAPIVTGLENLGVQLMQTSNPQHKPISILDMVD
jgi:hypothetical protein